MDLDKQIVHIRVGTAESTWYSSACGLKDTNLYMTSYMSKNLATCKACLSTFKDKSRKK